jgi:hypothetical protein
MSNQKITILTDEVRRLRKENSRLRMLMINYGPAQLRRKDGEIRSRWGLVKDGVIANTHLSAPEIARITGFDRHAIYAAARRIGVVLPSAYASKR